MQVTITNTFNAGSHDRGMKDYRIEVTENLSSWTIFKNGQLQDSRNFDCPNPVYPLEQQTTGCTGGCVAPGTKTTHVRVSDECKQCV